MANDVVVHPEPGQLKVISTKVTCEVIANFAWQHLKAATIFREHLIRLEKDHAGQPFGRFFENIRSYGSACIMSATASLEALINELFNTHNSMSHAQMMDFDSVYWGKIGIEKKPILKKYQTALEMLGKSRLDEHA